MIADVPSSNPVAIETIYTADRQLSHPRRFFSVAAAELVAVRRIGMELFRRNVAVKYRRAWLGYFWLLLPTLGTTAVWVYVQSHRLVAIAPTGLPYAVYVLAGTVLWQVFADALGAPLQQLSSAREIVARSRVPLEGVILAGVYEVLLNCAVRSVVLAGVVVAFHVRVGPSVFLVPLGVLALLTLGLALGTMLAPLGLLYEDVAHGMTVVTGLWFFLTPVLYRAPTTGMLRLNPVTPLLESARGWMTAPGLADGFVTVTAAAGALLLLAWLFQRVARPHVVATLGA